MGCRYSGYCAWRGVVRDSEAPEAAAAARRAYPELGSALYFELSEQRTHAVLYELPGQRLNWLWCGAQNFLSACAVGACCGAPWPAPAVAPRQPNRVCSGVMAAPPVPMLAAVRPHGSL